LRVKQLFTVVDEYEMGLTPVKPEQADIEANISNTNMRLNVFFIIFIKPSYRKRLAQSSVADDRYTINSDNALNFRYKNDF